MELRWRTLRFTWFGHQSRFVCAWVAPVTGQLVSVAMSSPSFELLNELRSLPTFHSHGRRAGPRLLTRVIHRSYTLRRSLVEILAPLSGSSDIFPRTDSGLSTSCGGSWVCIRFSADWHRLQRAVISSEQPSRANCPRVGVSSRSLSTSGISMSLDPSDRTQRTW